MSETAGVFLTITTTATGAGPASDLGYLLFKHPAKVQTFDLPVGRAHVFYPEVTEQRCTAALLLEVDPIALVRGKGHGARRGSADAFSLRQYVNDRPYAASSMLAVALGKVFSTAMTGRCDSRPELAAGPLPLTIHVPVLPCRGGTDLAQRYFGPLGWTVGAVAVAADPTVRRWGDSAYVDLHLTGEVRLADALHHLYVLLPVLDDTKHYWVGVDEVDKLVRAGAGWLQTHPEREQITRRYLAHQKELVLGAVGRLAEIDDLDADLLDNAVPREESEAPIPLAAARREAVLAALRTAGASSVVDLGCGEGALLAALLTESTFGRIIGVDVSHRALTAASRRLRLDTLSDRQRDRLTLLQSSLTYRDDRLAGQDAMVLMEVIEHVDPNRLEALQRNIFNAAKPRTVIITTPNAEYNVRYPDLPPGAFRHGDHRFEWSRAQFRSWCGAAAAAHGYQVRHLGVGPTDPELGSPTQLAIFDRSPS